MNEVIQVMLERYQCHSQEDYENAIKEIVQEFALLGLWRSHFFEKAAFYGGTALRILYGLDRFSEDMDFSLLEPDANFSLDKYNTAIESELKSMGFNVQVTTKNKTKKSSIESAFIKADTKSQFIEINAPAILIKNIHHQQSIKIKMEVDTDPPGSFTTEVRPLLQPIPFTVKTFTLPDLFAGKMHALLCRHWEKRVKGRDWYDFLWYLSRNVELNLNHLKARLVQSNRWPIDKSLTQQEVIELIKQRIEEVDFVIARNDIARFIKDKEKLSVWSKDFFINVLEKLKFQNQG